jgi:hypothetical protein
VLLSPANGKDAHVSICSGYVEGILVVFFDLWETKCLKKERKKYERSQKRRLLSSCVCSIFLNFSVEILFARSKVIGLST